MLISEQAREVQELYPLLYFSVHRKHTRDDGLSPSSVRILHHCAGPGASWASQLAEHLGLARSTVSEALSSLERDGWIAVSAPDGRRRRMVQVTERGRAAIEAREGLSRQQIEDILGRLSEREREDVVRGLRLLGTAIRRDDG